MSDWDIGPVPGPNAGVSVPIARGDTERVYVMRDQITRTPKVGYRGQLAATTAVLYTAPSLTNPPTGTAPCTSFVKSIVICNTDTSARTYTMTVVESGGSVADNRAIFKDVSIAAKTTHSLTFEDDTFPLADGETVNGLADSANKVTVRIGVVEYTY